MKVISLSKQLRKIRQNIALSIIFITGIFVCGFILLPIFTAIGDKTFGSYLEIILLVLCLFGIIFYVRNINAQRVQYRIVKAGLEGERTTFKLLKSLSDDALIFKNILLQKNGKSSELDFVVLSRRRLVIVESKALTGEITGRADEKVWRQKKIGAKGKVSSKEFYNPLFQVETHRKALLQSLEAEGIRIPVDVCVYFSSEKATVQTQPRIHNVFTNHKQNELRSYVLANHREVKMSDAVYKKIVRFLESKQI
ncbi:MAG: nuclease-related domain-containing protein [Bacilli bacterium]